jgi:hypothetical protein
MNIDEGIEHLCAEPTAEMARHVRNQVRLSLATEREYAQRLIVAILKRSVGLRPELQAAIDAFSELSRLESE